MELMEFEHPVARDIMTRLRNRSITKERFNNLSNRLSYLLAVEATRNLSTVPVEVDTPLEKTWGELCENIPVIIAVLRAGLGILKGFTDFLPEAPVGFLGVRRDEKTAEASMYYNSLPDMRGRSAFLLDPMLATGGTAELAIKYLRDNGCGEIVLISVVAVHEGISRLKSFKDLTIITASVDRELDQNWYIRPGLGDYGQRLYLD